MEELKNQLEKERKKIKKSMLGNQIMRFYITPLNEEILGKLILSTFNFTVIT
jgi:hypothetical protein